MKDPLLLGIETSCDETSAAVLSGASDLLGLVIHSQDEHQIYGGVVPELAARAHLLRIDDVIEAALNQAGHDLRQVDAIGVTAGPGLIGALMVGVTWSKAAAAALGVPLVPVHHMEAHLFAVTIDRPDVRPPFVGLLVSGGHTMLLLVEDWGRYTLLGQTRDDAVGEAFDKVAGALGLGYPGGPIIERLARAGDAGRFRFPRPMLRSDQSPGDADYFDFSFSGLKTAVALEVAELEEAGRLEANRSAVAAAFQTAAIDVLVGKSMRAVEAFGADTLVLGGGVAANGALRNALSEALGSGRELVHASPRLSLDNGAMIARTALFRLEHGDIAQGDLAPRADLPFPGLTPLTPSLIQ
jgi:N6-L-threonylcarbamoyladenine synthase